MHHDHDDDDFFLLVLLMPETPKGWAGVVVFLVTIGLLYLWWTGG